MYVTTYKMWSDNNWLVIDRPRKEKLWSWPLIWIAFGAAVQPVQRLWKEDTHTALSDTPSVS